MKCEIDLDKNQDFRKAFDVIVKYSPGDAFITFNQEGMNMRVMDSANIAMLKLKAKREHFTTWEVENEENVFVSLAQLAQLLKAALKKGVLRLESTPDLLSIFSTADGKVRKYTLRPLEIRTDNVKDVNIEYNGQETKVIYDDFQDAIEDVSVIEESVLLEHKDGAVIVRSKGTTSSAETALPATPMNSTISRYNPEYIQKIMAPICDKITLKWSKDMPLTIIHETPCVTLTGVIAPRVENEER